VNSSSITLYLAGLFASYFVGLKFGAAVKFLKELGRSA